MNGTLDESLIQEVDRTNVKYGGFWMRFVALIIDGVALAPLTYGLTYFNITAWKSAPIYIVITLVSAVYKPFMEFYFGATLGKMALNLKVVTIDLQRADMGKILLRNIFNLATALLSMLFAVGMYSDPNFEEVTGFQEFLMFSQSLPASAQYVSYASGILTIIDAIMLVADQQKRSLHDRIAGTLVIEK